MAFISFSGGGGGGLHVKCWPLRLGVDVRFGDGGRDVVRQRTGRSHDGRVDDSAGGRGPVIAIDHDGVVALPWRSFAAIKPPGNGLKHRQQLLLPIPSSPTKRHPLDESF